MIELWKNKSMISLPNEAWKEIIEFPGYHISSLGRVKSGGYYLKRPIILSQRAPKSGYLLVTFSIRNFGKKLLVHRLVAKSFIHNPENKETVNHINGIKFDNRAVNLEWATSSENSQHAYDKLGFKHIGLKGKHNSRSKPIKQLTLDGVQIKTFECLNDATNATGISTSLISRTCLGKQKTSGGFKWEHI